MFIYTNEKLKSSYGTINDQLLNIFQNAICIHLGIKNKGISTPPEPTLKEDYEMKQLSGQMK